MTPEEFLRRLEKLNIWAQRGRRAPHKPLLLLLSLGRVARRLERLARYQDIAAPLEDLLKRFGRPSKAHHPEFPFSRLPRDGLWEIPEADSLRIGASGDFLKSEMVNRGVKGGLRTFGMSSGSTRSPSTGVAPSCRVSLRSSSTRSFPAGSVMAWSRSRPKPPS